MKKRNFWSSCPKKYEFFPTKPCSFGRLGVDQTKGSGCKWFINSEPDHYCFWKWLRRKSNKQGGFEPLLQHQVADLLNCSSTKAHIIYKEAVEKIKHFEEFDDLKELF